MIKLYCTVLYYVVVLKCQLIAQSAHGLRVEQVQPDALRHGQPAAQDRAGLQVQHLLPRPHRQELHARVLSRELLFKYYLLP